MLSAARHIVITFILFFSPIKTNIVRRQGLGRGQVCHLAAQPCQPHARLRYRKLEKLMCTSSVWLICCIHVPVMPCGASRLTCPSKLPCMLFYNLGLVTVRSQQVCQASAAGQRTLQWQITLAVHALSIIHE